MHAPYNRLESLARFEGHWVRHKGRADKDIISIDPIVRMARKKRAKKAKEADSSKNRKACPCRPVLEKEESHPLFHRGLD
jgi:hypothetical protein